MKRIAHNGQLRITGGLPSTSRPIDARIEIDEYVPLRFTTRDHPIGAGTIRLGNYTSSLAELSVDPESSAIDGVTITSISFVSEWPDIYITEHLTSLPVLAEPIEGATVHDWQHDFAVAARGGEVVIFWSRLAPCAGYWCDNVCFLVAEDRLTGIWFTGLTIREVQTFSEHAEAK